MTMTSFSPSDSCSAPGPEAPPSLSVPADLAVPQTGLAVARGLAPPGWFRVPPPPPPVTSEIWHAELLKKRNMAKMCKTLAGEAPTTILVDKIPGKYIGNDLMQEWSDTNFGGTYDFPYFPMDNGTGGNVCYGFDDVVDASVAATFKAYVAASRMKSYEGYCPSYTEMARVSEAPSQGLEKKVESYKNPSISSDGNCHPSLQDQVDGGCHCLACRRSWRAGHPEMPLGGVCDQRREGKVCGEMLHAGMIKNNNSGHRRRWARRQYYMQSQGLGKFSL